VAPHQHLGDPAGSQRSFSLRFRFDQIFAPNNYGLPEALNLGPRELQSNELSTFLLKVSGRLKYFGLSLPFILPLMTMASGGTNLWRVFVSLANHARQTASRTLRMSLRSSGLDA
jgi:hypothetical protein